MTQALVRYSTVVRHLEVAWESNEIEYPATSPAVTAALNAAESLEKSESVSKQVQACCCTQHNVNIL